MAEVQHGTLRPGAASGIHVVHDYEVADAAARLALTVIELDVGRVCRQLSDNTWWILARFTGGVVWKRIDVDAIPPALSNTMPAPLGAAAPGTANEASRGDHVHAHGDQVGGSLHPVATGLVAGFMSATMVTEHQQLAAAGPAPAPGPAPVNVTKAAAAPGIAATYSRSDHKHDVTAGAPVDIGSGNQEGTSTSLARADHVHALAAADRAKLDNATALTSAAPANVTKAAAAPGVATDAARADHKHDIATAAPVSVGTSNAEGGATSLARSDHVHDHGAQPLGTGNQHAVATTTVAGFMAAADKVALAGKADKNFSVINWNTTALTLDATHADALIVFTGTANATLTIPSDAMASLGSFACCLYHGGSDSYSITINDANVTLDSVIGCDALDGLPGKGFATFARIAANKWITNGTYGSTGPT